MKTSRKDFIRSAAVLGFGGMSLAVEAASQSQATLSNEPIRPVNGKYLLPPLGYAYNALEPYIDAKTMEIHHSKHHQAYVNKLNEAIEKEPSLKDGDLNELLRNLNGRPDTVRLAVRNQGGGHWNHSFFWPLLKTKTKMGPKTNNLVIESFGSIDEFKRQFEKAANGIFGSGWAWVILQGSKLKIVTTPNQDNPVMDFDINPTEKGKPIIGLDVWEHAYYLKHQNKRADYVNAFWNVLNWDQVEMNTNE